MAPMADKEKGSKGNVGKASPEEPLQQLPIEDIPDPSRGTGKFYYASGATYEGEWIIAPDPNEAAKAELEAKSIEKGSKGKVKGEKSAKDEKKKSDQGKTPPKSPTKEGASKDSKREEEKAIVEGQSSVPEQPRPNRFRHGRGVYIDGEYRYEGEWKDDQISGQGTFRYASGATYEGNWDMSKYFGQGEYKWADGRSYKGDWRDNKMHGMGIYTDKSGRQYVGHFFKGIGPGLSCEIK